MRTASDPLRASRKRIAELRNLGNGDPDRPGRLVDPVIDRFFTRDQSYEAIGRELAIPAGTIASRISRCLGKLRVTLAEVA